MCKHIMELLTVAVVVAVVLTVTLTQNLSELYKLRENVKINTLDFAVYSVDKGLLPLFLFLLNPACDS